MRFFHFLLIIFAGVRVSTSNSFSHNMQANQITKEYEIHYISKFIGYLRLATDRRFVSVSSKLQQEQQEIMTFTCRQIVSKFFLHLFYQKLIL